MCIRDSYGAYALRQRAGQYGRNAAGSHKFPVKIHQERFIQTAGHVVSAALAIIVDRQRRICLLYTSGRFSLLPAVRCVRLGFLIPILVFFFHRYPPYAAIRHRLGSKAPR